MENIYSFILEEVDEYKENLFQTRANEGFLGNGYDWESLASIFLEEQMPDLADSIDFVSEADIFCAYSSDKDDSLCNILFLISLLVFYLIMFL